MWFIISCVIIAIIIWGCCELSYRRLHNSKVAKKFEKACDDTIDKLFDEYKKYKDNKDNKDNDKPRSL